MYKKNNYWFVIKNKAKTEELFKFDAGTEVRKKIIEFMYKSRDQKNQFTMSYPKIAEKVMCHRESVMKAVTWAEQQGILLKSSLPANKKGHIINIYKFILYTSD